MKKKFIYLYLILFVFFIMNIFFIYSVSAGEEFSIFVTSNLGGRFSVNETDENKESMLVLAQSMLSERKIRKADIYIDLGNAFYPGLLSKYSYGSVMMDFFNFFSCDAVLVSSKDLRIGIDNLQFLSSGKKTDLLSANIVRNKKTIFTPYFIRYKGNTSVAFTAISSKKINFDIAEKNIYGIKLKNESEALNETIRDIESRGISHIVLLSGLGIKDTVSLLSRYKQIQLALCGGDNTGDLFSDKASRIDLADGRTVLLLPEGDMFYSLNLRLDGQISVSNLRRITPAPVKIYSRDYSDFVNRLALWKEKFKAENEQVISSTDNKKIIINDIRLSGLLRDKYNSEIAIVERNTILESTFSRDIKRSDLLHVVNIDYNIFIFNLKGEDLKNIPGDETLLIDGVNGDKIQGYSINDARIYRIAATQPAFEKVEQILRKDIPYQNTWTNITDIITSDFKEKHILFLNDYSYLDKYFRATVDFYLSNFFENNIVKRSNSFETPPGQAEENYKRWGLENKIDLTIYNRYHRILLSPYMFYERQDEQYINNLLRGTLTYNLNLYNIIKPYQKSQADTVIKETDGLRPVILRETIGIDAITDNLQSKVGVGFEKYTHDPDQNPVYGIEFLIGYKLPFLNYFSYSFNIDSFISARSLKKTKRHIRSELLNSLSASINQFLSISLKYRWFYYYSGENMARYENYQTIISADLRTDFKIW
jgi:2',3'-cyclic-nucleotide 2'-phosphodiesterase (5'-nucleotidase family)